MTMEIVRLSKWFGSFRALDDVSLTVERGELLALLGPSGSGKTTLLRLIAGLETPDAGTLRLDGEDAAGLSPRQRGVGFVFQHYALFRHMSVFENIAFGLRVLPRRRRPSETEIRRRVGGLLDMVRLAPFADRLPAQLSGGQRQRVALARALCVEPRLLLLDEPFGALDAQVRKELRRWLRQLHDEMGITSVFVTHDQEEALELADRVVVMNRGRIEQVGTPGAVYDHPGSAFVHDFLGESNHIPCHAADRRMVSPVLEGLEIPPATPDAGTGADTGAMTAHVRPHDLEIMPDPAGRAVVIAARVIGANAHVDIGLDQTRLEAALPSGRWSALGLTPGTPCTIAVRRAHVFPSA